MLFSGAVAMTVAFLYMLLWMLSHYTSHGQKLGVQSYDTQVECVLLLCSLTTECVLLL